MAHLVTAHSFYSLLEGVNPPAALALHAAEKGCKTLALTDHNLLTGAVEFSLACRKADIRPIFGLEVDIKDSSANTISGQLSRLTLLSENAEGWSNLCRLRSLTNLEGSRPLTIEEIARHSDGVICLTGGAKGGPNLRLRQGMIAEIKLEGQEYAKIFHDRLYFRITGAPHLESKESILSNIYAQLNIPSTLAAEIFYLDQADEPLHRLLCAIRNNTTLQKISVEYGYAQFGSFPEAHILENSEIKFPQAYQNA